MALLSSADRETVRHELERMVEPVRLVLFTQTLGCETCAPTRQILDELVAVSDKLSLEEVNYILDKEKVAEYGIDRVPAVAVVGAADPGIRFYGLPAGYEFMNLVDAVLMVSSGESGLSEESRAIVAAVTEPTTIQVFVTPT